MAGGLGSAFFRVTFLVGEVFFFEVDLGLGFFSAALAALDVTRFRERAADVGGMETADSEEELASSIPNNAAKSSPYSSDC